MDQKEITTKENFMAILELLDGLGMKYWVDGGWGIDVLAGRETRKHRDVDINFDGEYTQDLLQALKERGYVVTTDWSPCRIELQHPEAGYVDIHPLVLAEDGSARQADQSGGFYELEADWFSSGVFEGRRVPCTSAEGQRVFHSGYELRDKDQMDLQTLEALGTGFRAMRRGNQELNKEECEAVLERGTAGVLAVHGDADYPYAVPLSYVYDQGRILFHCALRGHKLDAIVRNHKASFCVIDQDRVVPAEYTTYYRSVICFGRVRKLEEAPEKRKALELLAARYTPDDEAGRLQEVDKSFAAVCMLELFIEHMTGKEARELKIEHEL